MRENIQTDFPNVEVDWRYKDSVVAKAPSANWQVIFKVKRKLEEDCFLDYCRETKDGSKPIREIAQWAHNRCNGLNTKEYEFYAVIERW